MLFAKWKCEITLAANNIRSPVYPQSAQKALWIQSDGFHSAPVGAFTFCAQTKRPKHASEPDPNNFPLISEAQLSSTND